MTQDAQISLVNQLCVGLALDIGTLIDDGKIPADWDGHELRALIAEKAIANASISAIRREPRSARANAYRNHINITSL